MIPQFLWKVPEVMVPAGKQEDQLSEGDTEKAFIAHGIGATGDSPRQRTQNAGVT